QGAQALLRIVNGYKAIRRVITEAKLLQRLLAGLPGDASLLAKALVAELALISSPVGHGIEPGRPMMDRLLLKRIWIEPLDVRALALSTSFVGEDLRLVVGRQAESACNVALLYNASHRQRLEPAHMHLDIDLAIGRDCRAMALD